MATEIIKTEDSNIVIERTFIDTEVDISKNQEIVSAYADNLTVIYEKLEELRNYNGLPASVQEAINFQISQLENEARFFEQEIERLSIL